MLQAPRNLSGYCNKIGSPNIIKQKALHFQRRQALAIMRGMNMNYLFLYTFKFKCLLDNMCSSRLVQFKCIIKIKNSTIKTLNPFVSNFIQYMAIIHNQGLNVINITKHGVIFSHRYVYY